MTGKTKTVVIIETHQQTIIRRSWRTIEANEARVSAEPQPALLQVARSVGTLPDETDPIVQEKRASRGRRWKKRTLKPARLVRALYDSLVNGFSARN